MSCLLRWDALSFAAGEEHRDAPGIGELELSRCLLRLATDAAEIGTWDLDPAADVLTASDRTKALHGFQPNGPGGMADLYAGLHSDDVEAMRAAFTSALDPIRRAAYGIEYRVVGPDGAIRWVEAKGRGIFGPHGQCIRAIGTAIDITPRKMAEQRQRAQEAQLAAGRRHVTAEKNTAEALAQAQEQLRQSLKLQAVGQLTGGIAHDFNNLLTGIIGNLELMQRRISAGRVDGLDRYAAMAATSAERAAALAQRLLAFARRQPLDPQRVEANRLLSGMEDLLRRTLEPTVGLEMALADALWPTLCDPNQLENAVLNLAINARDAMPEGGRLTVETANAHLDAAHAEVPGGMRAGQYVAIAMTDTGLGMGPEVAARAFDPFFTTKPTGQGTGLGLSMLYGFVKQSGGHVRVDSEPGLGTTFTIYLPRCRSEGAGGASEIGEDSAAALQAGAGWRS